MIPLFLPEQVQAMDRRAFDRGIDPAALMDLAAHHLARGVLELAGVQHLPRHGLRVALVCGKGNNGGDGVAAARHLAARGAACTVVLIAPAADLGPDAARELAAWEDRRGRVIVAEDRAALDAAMARADLVVDCLLGTGSGGAPRGVYAHAVAAINACTTPVVACDLPTGLDGVDGSASGEVVRAELTVTLGAHKQGLWVGEGPSSAGHVLLGELDIVDGRATPVASVLEATDLPVLLPPAGRTSDKRARGVVALWAGSSGMTGAAVLAARAALAVGAGLVTVATAEAAADVVRRSVPEAMTVALPEDDADGICQRIAGLLERADVLAIGPGLGLSAATQQAVRRLVATVEAPVVLDADGLNAFRDHRDGLAGHASSLLAMTPHASELARLTGLDPGDVDRRRPAVAADAAGRWRAVVVAKGPGTVIAAPDGRMWVNATGGPALASGGTGDVLTGVTAALLAQRAAPEVVAAAVHLHGLAGDLAAGRHGVRATTASAVIDTVGAAAVQLGI